MGEMRNAFEILVRNLEGKNHLEDLGTDGRMIQEWILGKQGEKMWTGLIWIRLGTSGRFL
jgi:hypothetical protein